MSYSSYKAAIRLIERLHRRSLGAISQGLERKGWRNLSSVQAMILYNIGRRSMTVGELTQRGCYLGSNVSYNVRKMVENGYLKQSQAEHDKRSSYVGASERGLEVCNYLEDELSRHASRLEAYEVDYRELDAANNLLRKLLRFWSAPIFPIESPPSYADSFQDPVEEFVNTAPTRASLH